MVNGASIDRAGGCLDIAARKKSKNTQHALLWLGRWDIFHVDPFGSAVWTLKHNPRHHVIVDDLLRNFPVDRTDIDVGATVPRKHPGCNPVM